MLGLSTESSSTIHQGRFEEAEAAFRKATDLEPTNGHAWRWLGWLLDCHLGQFEEAEVAFRKAIDLDPSDVWSLTRLGQLLSCHLQQFEEAEAAFRKAIDLDPKNPRTLNIFGTLLADFLGKYEEAEVAFRKTIDLDPSNAWSWSGLGKLLDEVHGRYDEAEAAYRKAIELDPSNAWSWSGMGSLLEKCVERYEEAEIAFDNAVKLEPDVKGFHAKLSQIRHRRLLAPMIAAVAAENWGIVREHLERWIADPQAGLELWVSDVFIDNVVGAAVRLGRGEPLLRLMREVGLERVALPLLLATEAALVGNADDLVDVEPEARTTAENLYLRLTAPPSK